MDNVYLAAWQEYTQNGASMNVLSWAAIWPARERLVRQYSWAVPNDKALEEIALHSPIVEMGAGTGYWAQLLHERGVSVQAFDESPMEDGKNHFHNGGLFENKKPTSFFPVSKGNPKLLCAHTNFTLFLCWPPMDEMAEECLKYWKGSTLIYIGEGNGGCTATDEFHEELERSFELIKTIDIPQWPGMHDYLGVYRRTQ